MADINEIAAELRVIAYTLGRLADSLVGTATPPPMTTPVNAASDLLTTEEFADLARTNVETVRHWRKNNHGPQGFKLGRRVLYPRAEVLAWIEAQRHG